MRTARRSAASRSSSPRCDEAGAGPSTSSARGSSRRAPTIFEEVARAHGAVFGDVRPACTYVVAQLIDPRWHVEIEAEALVE